MASRYLLPLLWLCASCFTDVKRGRRDQYHLSHCDEKDYDWIVQGLVSPAPQSYDVINAVICKMRDEGSDVDLLFEDLRALYYLVKEGYALELYHNDFLLKWTVSRCARESSPQHGNKLSPDRRNPNVELYHKHDVLELSRKSLAMSIDDPNRQDGVLEIAMQAQKRLALTQGTDLRGPTSADAAFNFALSGVQETCLFEKLVIVAVTELKRTGHRAQFKIMRILHMVEKFAACDVRCDASRELFSIAADCLKKKGFDDQSVIAMLRGGRFGLQSDRPLMWLWRHSSRQAKVSLSSYEITTSARAIEWERVFEDTSRSLVVDLGSGMGSALLNLSVFRGDTSSAECHEDTLRLEWPQMNYAGADVNQHLVNFSSGIVSRDPRRDGRVFFACLEAASLLEHVQKYPGACRMIMCNFPSPYRLGSGNLQLPKEDQFMITESLLKMVVRTLSKDGLFLFQTKCEDVAIRVKELCLSLGSLTCVKFCHHIDDIESEYTSSGSSRPDRVGRWLEMCRPHAERGQGEMFASNPILPREAIPETEVECIVGNNVVHRLLFRMI
ncbi:hypothetical protein THAOC_02508 [Thalassiosira oceanica]|uniref:tRNA (guanine(46)-N(7))-methyltransferase n=1 Tax=Thalassiosira oceanica TaxID=159749 RepID=K0TEF4_THAOC|nr:hypothetical protein THAOC_02508 [Thalassiosira oceanica]|eukprot:EJK75760.1 hypothetical protein THAOC_02508 [Thalassiosira oceanica]